MITQVNMLGAGAMNEHEELLWRRLRARVYSRRSVEKKKTTINALRRELAALELQYTKLVQTTANSSLEEADSSLLSRFLQLATLKEKLCRENQSLHAIASERMIQEARLQQIVDMAALTSVIDMPFQFRSLTIDQCNELIESCRDDALRFVSCRERQSSGHEVVGWRGYREVVGDMVEFSLEKTFVNMSATDLANRTWAMLMNPDLNCRVYNMTTNPHLELLQRIGENSAIFYRRIRPPGSSVTFKTIVLLARVEIPSGVFIASRSIDPDLIGFNDGDLNALIEELRDPMDCGIETNWATLDNWVRIEKISDTSCKYVFGGASKALWTVEVLLMCLRFENLVLGSRLLPLSR